MKKLPSAMQKVQEEIRNVGGMKRSVTEDENKKLPYLKLVIKETLRLYPAIPLVPKETIATSIINGYEIEPKTLVFVNIWAICRDPEYEENLEEFFPELFLNTTSDYKGKDFDRVHSVWIYGVEEFAEECISPATVELELANILYMFDRELPHGTREQDIDAHSSIGLIMRNKNPLSLMAKTYN